MRIGNDKKRSQPRVVALTGNPNVGKSTVFNALTNMNQHTGNWPGKTVAKAQGEYSYEGMSYSLVDLPGAYSLAAHSCEEEITRDFLLQGDAMAAIVVCDATCLERNLILALQVMEIMPNVVICVNLMDEAAKKGIEIDIKALERELGVPVVATSARSKKGLNALMESVREIIEREPCSEIPRHSQHIQDEPRDVKASRMVTAAQNICAKAVSCPSCCHSRDRKLDRLLTSKRTGIPVMLTLLCLVFYITLIGANYPSQLLAAGANVLQDWLYGLLNMIGAPSWLNGALVTGVFRVLGWVVSVMLPPMAIFFPLFTLFEDFGYLPRVAFNLDHHFKKACACGKQALTMAMGFGCNAVGVTGCRIIDSPRERLIAILTNSLVPCNGRFPALIMLISMFFVTASAAFNALFSAVILTALIALGIFATFVVSRLLSCTILKGEASSFTLELPPYRAPQIGRVIVRSLLDRTLFVLGRAVCVAAPAGLVIWALANISTDGMSLLNRCAMFIDPFARALGMDGVILIAFILGFPANEIVVPIMIMAYLSSGMIEDVSSIVELKAILTANGWTRATAVSTTLFCLFHWPCSTTCLTIRKETGGFKWVALSIAIPTLLGMGVCFLFTSIVRIVGLI